MSSETAIPPPVLWAQKREDVFLTFNVESKDPVIKIEKDSVYFKGLNEQDKKTNEVTIPLYDTVLPDSSAYVNRGRCIEMILRKEKKDASFWPALLKDKKKPHYLKIDFNKWSDEDEDNENRGGGGGGPMNVDMEEMLRSMSGVGGAGDKADKPSFDDLENDDSDDDNLPDLE